MRHFPTSVENIVLNLIFEWLGESRFNRTNDEYMQIAACIPKLEACHAYVNQRLQEYAKSGNPPFGAICNFKAGQSNAWYKPFPTSISLETVRTALIVSGMREPRPPRQRKCA
jgi:hypothetical protein